MNLFRSEEHVRRWDGFDTETADGIMPVANWFGVFDLPVFARRLDANYLEKLPGYVEEVFAAASQISEAAYWQTPQS
jgi:hypothetical protein